MQPIYTPKPLHGRRHIWLKILLIQLLTFFLHIHWSSIRSKNIKLTFICKYYITPSTWVLLWMFCCKWFFSCYTTIIALIFEGSRNCLRTMQLLKQFNGDPFLFFFLLLLFTCFVYYLNSQRTNVKEIQKLLLIRISISCPP